MSSTARYAAAMAGAVLAVAAPAFAAGGLSVAIDEATPVTLGGPASQVVVGNPAVADVTLIDRRRLMVLGRSYGVTNVMAFDQNGRAIYNARVTVTPSDTGRVSVYKGPNVQNYACGARCERTPMPGELGDVYTPYATPYKDYADRAKPPAAGN